MECYSYVFETPQTSYRLCVKERLGCPSLFSSHHPNPARALNSLDAAAWWRPQVHLQARGAKYRLRNLSSLSAIVGLSTQLVWCATPLRFLVNRLIGLLSFQTDIGQGLLGTIALALSSRIALKALAYKQLQNQSAKLCAEYSYNKSKLRYWILRLKSSLSQITSYI